MGSGQRTRHSVTETQLHCKPAAAMPALAHTVAKCRLPTQRNPPNSASGQCTAASVAFNHDRAPSAAGSALSRPAAPLWMTACCMVGRRRRRPRVSATDLLASPARRRAPVQNNHFVSPEAVAAPPLLLCLLSVHGIHVSRFSSASVKGRSYASGHASPVDVGLRYWNYKNWQIIFQFSPCNSSRPTSTVDAWKS